MRMPPAPVLALVFGTQRRQLSVVLAPFQQKVAVGAILAIVPAMVVLVVGVVESDAGDAAEDEQGGRDRRGGDAGRSKPRSSGHDLVLKVRLPARAGPDAEPPGRHFRDWALVYCLS